MSTLPIPDDEIPDVWSLIINAIAEGESAWSTPDEILSAVGLDEDEVLDQIAEMDLGGLIDLWERPEGIVVTLSVYSADRFGFVLVEVGRNLDLRWARLGDPEPETRAGGRGIRSDAMARAVLVLDSHPGPDSDAELSETAAQYLRNGRFGTLRKGAGRGEPPRPTLLIGSTRDAWPGSSKGIDEPCPACGDRVLPAHAYCLCCDRWGLDSPDAPRFRSNRSARNPQPDSKHASRCRPDPTDRGGRDLEGRPRSKPNRCGCYRQLRLLERDRRRGIDPGSGQG